MADPNDSAGRNSSLTSTGDVTVGVALEGAEREASLERGGDGLAGEFRGGYLSAGQGAEGELNLGGKAMSMCLRFRLAQGISDTPLFSKHGGQSTLPIPSSPPIRRRPGNSTRSRPAKWYGRASGT
jgi:hypothetical protein